MKRWPRFDSWWRYHPSGATYLSIGSIAVMAVAIPRDILLARRAKRHGAKWALRIILEARRAGIPISLGFALVEHESRFANIFGHDPTSFRGGGQVTRKKYAAYKAKRGTPGRTSMMQGVGPCQLTWWEFQDGADALGGCYKPKYNIRRAFSDLAAMIKQHGHADGIGAYNGSGLAATRYSRDVRALESTWHRWLTA